MSTHSELQKIGRNFVPEIGCVGKVTFSSYSAAEKVVKRNGPKAPRGRVAYLCGICNQWHIGADQFGMAKKRNNAIKERRHGL